MPDTIIATAAKGFFGWRVVGAAFVSAMFAWGISFYGPPIFLQVLHEGRGWGLELIASAISLHFLTGALVVARLAALHRRFGQVATIRAGVVLTALGLLGWAFAAAPWQLFLVAPVSAAGWALTSGAALNAMIAPWFVRRRPAALGMAFNGASLGGAVFSPLWVGLIAALGFRGAAIAVAASLVLVMWVLAGRYFGRDPAAMGLAPDGDAVEVAPAAQRAKDAACLPNPWCDRRFLTLAAAASLGLFAQIGLVAHLFSLLVPALGAGLAGTVMGAATGCAIGGRAALGLLIGPRTDRRVVAAANVAMQAAGSLVLLAAGGTVPLLLLGCGLFGLGLGNVTSLPPLIAQTEFRPADVARVVALVTATSQASYAFAPALFALLREAGGGAALFAVAALVQVAAAGVVLAGKARGRAEPLDPLLPSAVR
jgi:MFS family permease